MNIQTVCVLAVLWNGAHIYCQEADDPCRNYEEIPDLASRHPNYTLRIGERSLNDLHLKKGWYGNVHYRVSAKPPPLGRCGSRYPIWRGKSANETRALMCVRTRESSCLSQIEVLVKNCSTFEVYQLKQSTVQYSSYCFEPTSPKDLPTFIPRTTITPDVVHISSTKSDFRFRCKFSSSSKDELYYETDWYIDGRSFHKFAPMLWSNDYINSTVLTESLLLEKGKRAGFNVQCAVRARNGPSLPPGPHRLSAEYFAGFTVPPIYNLRHGQEAQVLIQSLVPFGCGTSVADQDCNVTISVRYLPAKNTQDKLCKPGTVLAESCEMAPITVKQSSVTMTLMGQVTDVKDNYDDIQQFELVAYSDSHPFFENYTIGQVKVRLRGVASEAIKERCELTNDPFLRVYGRYSSTYSGTEGVFTLYRHNIEPIEVQVQVQNCSIGSGSCTCGLAVRVGKTLFVISMCETGIWTRDFRSCGTDSEEVDVRGISENTYEIHLPTGGWLDVTYDRHNLNAHFYPSARDVGNCSGLCGVLPSGTSGRFIMKNGESTTNIEEHFDSWRVTGDNLFQNLSPISLKERYTSSRKYCTCGQSVNGTAQVVCSAMTASAKCKGISKYKPVKKARCSVIMGHKRLELLMARRRQKREVAREWTELEAKAYCDNLYSRSATVDVCRDVPGVHVDRSKMQCVGDIMVSGTTAFANMSIESVRVPCIHEVAVNSTLRRKDPSQPSIPSVLEMVMSRSCPGDCTGRGSCHSGKCVCVADYGGPDCSVDLSSPPEVYTAEDGGHCDLTTSDCDELAVYGEIFTGSSNATCRVKKYKLHGGESGPDNPVIVIMSIDLSNFDVAGNGVLEYEAMVSAEATVEGMNEMVCLLRPRVRRQVMPTPDTDYVVTSYAISVSNTGDIFSDEVTVLVYDSTCVQIDGNTKQWTIKEGFCVIKSRCIPKAVAVKGMVLVHVDMKNTSKDPVRIETYCVGKSEMENVPTEPSTRITAYFPFGSALGLCRWQFFLAF